MVPSSKALKYRFRAVWQRARLFSMVLSSASMEGAFSASFFRADLPDLLQECGNQPADISLIDRR